MSTTDTTTPKYRDPIDLSSRVDWTNLGANYKADIKDVWDCYVALTITPHLQSVNDTLNAAHDAIWGVRMAIRNYDLTDEDTQSLVQRRLQAVRSALLNAREALDAGITPGRECVKCGATEFYCDCESGPTFATEVQESTPTPRDDTDPAALALPCSVCYRWSSDHTGWDHAYSPSIPGFKVTCPDCKAGIPVDSSTGYWATHLK